MTTTELPALSWHYDDEGLPVVDPVTIGPTWQRDEHGDFVLPERTIGYLCAEWAEENLLGPDGNAWRFTPEQYRFLLWWYAIDENGQWLYQEAVLQRLKGWGKDPFLAVICAIEFVGPCRFVAWDGLGEPIAEENPQAWIQVAAVSQEQTRNTMQVIQTLFSAEAKRKYKIRLGVLKSYAFGAERYFEAVTSSPTALEGGRATFVVKNETHHWLSNNQGHEMNAVIDRNATKSAGGSSRTLAITNAYDPSQGSVAQETREAYDEQEGGTTRFSGLLYDSLEAPPDAPLDRLDGPDGPGIESVLRGVRGDSVWLDIPRMVKAIMDPRNPPSRSRRFWYNQIVAAEDAWADPAWIDATARPDTEIAEGEEVVLFGDGSKSDDSTGLVGCRLSDGHLFTWGVWQKPRGDRGKGWLAPRNEVDERVNAAFERFTVVGFFFDPSHAKDDSDSSSYWTPLADEWHRKYSARLKLWAVAAGNEKHSVLWDMASPNRQGQFVNAAEQFVEDLESGRFTHDGHGALKAHLRNARRYPTNYGVSLSKRHRESADKIDLAVCAVGARLVRRLVLNKGVDEVKKTKASGRVWGVVRS